MRLRYDHRYVDQQLRRNQKNVLPTAQGQQLSSRELPGGDSGILQPIAPPFRRRVPIVSDQSITDSLHSDWGMSLLGNATTGAEMFPAKFTFDVNAAPDCANDFTVFNTGVAGANGVDASQFGTFSGNPSDGQTITVTNGASVLVLTASATLNTGFNFQIGPDTTTTTNNLLAAFGREGFAALVFATSAGPVITVHAGNPGTAGDTITLASTLSGFAWNGPTLTGGQGQASIIAFNNLYATQGSAGGLCNSNGPTVMWSYFTGSNPVLTSPVISGDGTKIAFVENPSGSAAILHLLQWKAGEGPNVVNAFFPGFVLPAGQPWTSCTAGSSCVRNIVLNGSATAGNSNSSPYYDYNDDILYVGDDAGRLHKFTGVFNGTPAEVVSSPWPIPVHAAILSSPVFDTISRNIFVGDKSGLLSYVMESGSTTGTCTAGTGPGGTSVPPCLGVTNIQVGEAGAIVDAPIVDGTNGTVFAFNGAETNDFGTILQTNTLLTGVPATPAGPNVILHVGGTAVGSYIHAGTFDNAYLNSSQGATTGHLYVCAKDPAFVDRPAIFRLSFAADGTLSSTLGTALIGLTKADGTACSPITEVENPNATGGAKEWIFFSVGNHVNNTTPIPAGSCTTAGAGCVISIDITSGLWPPAMVSSAVSVPAGPLTGPNGGNIDSTSGIIIDNVAADPTATLQVSSLYFSLTSNSTGSGPGIPSCNTTPGVGCAIKLTQAALQ
jgi:hypothetical protein